MALEIGREYYWKRTDGWTWIDGSFRWWEVFIRIDGYNGAGGYWLTEFWRWNGSPHNTSTQPRTLSYEDSRQLEQDIEQQPATEPEGE